MFKKTKRKLKLALAIPTTLLLSMSALLIGFSLSIYNVNFFNSQIVSSLDFNIEKFNLEISMLDTFNSNIKKDNEIMNYMMGVSDDESTVRQRLTNRVNQFNYLIGESLYPFNNNETSSLQIGGLVSKDHFFSIPQIQELLKSNDQSLLFLRDESINKTYYLSNYDSSFGMLSLVNVIKYDDKILGLLVCDFDTQSVYNRILSFNDYEEIKTSEFFIKENDCILKESMSKESYITDYKISDKLSLKSCMKLGIKKNLIDEIDILATFNLQKLNNEILIIWALIIIVILGINVIFIATSKKLIDSTFNSLELINQKITRTLE